MDQLQSRLETAEVRSIELALAGQGPGLSASGLHWVVITIRARVRIMHGYPADLTLVPGQRHKVTLLGEFQTLIISSTENGKDAVLWVRFKDGGPTDLFQVKDLRKDSLSFEIPGEAVAAGAEHYLEVGGTPSVEAGPQVLALSPFKITLSAHLPIVDFQPRVALTSSLRGTSVTLEVLLPPAQGRSLACAQRRPSSSLSFTWSPAISIAPRRFECLLEDGRAGAHELGLGYSMSSLEDSQLLTDLVRLQLVHLEVTGLAPTAGPTDGSTLVRLQGTGFLSLAVYGGGLMCQFGNGGPTVTATPLTDKLLECLSPRSSRNIPVVVDLISQDALYHSVSLSQLESTLRLRTFSYFVSPSIASIYPPIVSYSGQRTLNITVFLISDIQKFEDTDIKCQLRQEFSGRHRPPAAQVVAQIINGNSVSCSFPFPDWLLAAEYCELALSLNGGANFSPSYGGIRVFQTPRIRDSSGLLRHAHPSADGLILSIHDLSELSSSAICRVTTTDDDEEISWSLPALLINTTHVECLDAAGVLASLRAGEAIIELHDPVLGL